MSRSLLAYIGAPRFIGEERLNMTDSVIDEGYRPTEDEPFMNERQREYFRRKLIRWKHDILKEAQETLATPAERERESP